MVKNVSKRFLATLLALLMVVTLIPNVVLAVNVTTGVEGLTASYTNGSWTLTNGVLKGTATGTSPSCGEPTSTTSTLTLKNSSGSSAVLKFDYAKPTLGTEGSVKINGTAVTVAGTFEKELAADDSITVVIYSGKAGSGNTSSVDLSNLQLVVKKQVTVTFDPPTAGGSFTVNGSAVTASMPVAQESTTAYELKATANNGYEFMGWKSSVNGFVSTKATDSILFEENQTVTAVFKPKGAPTWEVGNEWFSDLNDAITYATSANIAKIVLVANGTLPAGDYTIPSGKTVLIPFDAAQTVYTTKPDVVYGSHATPTAFRTLTMASGANITVASGGKLCVPSKLSASGTGSGSWNGTPTGAGGRIAMSTGSTIDVQSGGGLYVYGYISGSGNVYARSGATVWEAFQIRSWRGGNATSGLLSTNVFPINQYYVQNIEVPMTLYAGATEKVYTAVNANSRKYDGTATFIGSDGMFVLSSGSVTKQYLGATDRLQVDVNGDTKISSLSIQTDFATMNTANFVLPITNNITIKIHSGTISAPSQDIAFLPGSELEIDSGANVTFGSNVYIYDQSEWGPYAMTNLNMIPVGYSTVNGTTAKRNNNSLVDAKIDVNGTATVSGKLYTTSSGANITSSGKTGKIVLSTAPTATSKTYQATQTSNQASTVDIPVTAAQLLNGDGSYTQTAGASAGATFFYCAAHDKWETGGTTVTFNANGGEGTMTDQTLCAEGGTLSANAFTRAGFTFEGWNTAADGSGTVYADGANVQFKTPTTLYAQWKEVTYTVTWKNDDGTVLETDENVAPGATPSYDGETPAKASTAQYDYTFAGWTPVITAVTGDVTYTATYTSALRSYTITWKDDTGAVIDAVPVTYGATPSHADPVKASTAQYDYTFAGWTPAITAVTGDATYTATFTPVPRSYTITWTNDDDSVIDETSVAYGETPTHADAAKDADAQYTYTFTGWTPAITAVTGDATYKATYSTTLRSYTIKFLVADTETVFENVDFGTPIRTIQPDDPSKTDESGVYAYQFVGWQLNDGSNVLLSSDDTVTGDATYVAVFDETERTYTFVWYDGVQEDPVYTATGTLNAKPEYTGDTPTKPADAQYTYCFSKWIEAISGDTVTYTADYSATVNTYTVTWVSEGETLATDAVAYGETPAYTGETPKKAADAYYSYTFLGWTPEIAAVTGDVTYIAEFASTGKINVSFFTQQSDDGAATALTGGVTDSATVQQQPNYPSFLGYSFTGVLVVCGDQQQLVGVKDGTVANEDLNAAIEAVLAASDSQDVTVTAQYAQDAEQYTVVLMYQLPGSDAVYNYTTEARNVGDAVKLTAPETRASGGATYSFDHWLVDGKEYHSLSITLRPEKAGAFTAVAVYAQGETVRDEPVLDIVNAYAETQNGVDKVAVTLTYNVTAANLRDGKIVEVGFRVSATDATLATYKTAKSKLTTPNGTYTLHINATNKQTTPIYVCAYLIYIDADGNQQTLTTDPVGYIWNAMS